MAENEELLLLTEKIERELICEYGHLIKVCNKVGEGEFNFACGIAKWPVQGKEANRFAT